MNRGDPQNPPAVRFPGRHRIRARNFPRVSPSKRVALQWMWSCHARGRRVIGNGGDLAGCNGPAEYGSSTSPPPASPFPERFSSQFSLSAIPPHRFPAAPVFRCRCFGAGVSDRETEHARLGALTPWRMRLIGQTRIPSASSLTGGKSGFAGDSPRRGGSWKAGVSVLH